MNRAEFTLAGDRRLASQLRGMERAARGTTLHRALVSGALLIANQAKRNAPYRTGNLRRSIHIGGEGASGGLEGNTTGTDIGGQEIGRDYAEVSVGTNVDYAPHQEFGTARQPGTPFLRPALESERGAAQAEIADALRAQLRRAVR